MLHGEAGSYDKVEILEDITHVNAYNKVYAQTGEAQAETLPRQQLPVTESPARASVRVTAAKRTKSQSRMR